MGGLYCSQQEPSKEGDLGEGKKRKKCKCALASLLNVPPPNALTIPAMKWHGVTTMLKCRETKLCICLFALALVLKNKIEFDDLGSH